MTGIGPSSEVIPLRMPLHIKVGQGLLGRVLNGLGQAIDVETHGGLVLRRLLLRDGVPAGSVKTANDQRAYFRRRAVQLMAC